MNPPGALAHAFHPRMQRQVDVCELKTSLVHTMSSGPARIRYRKPI